ncbi:MAG TPA: hypothetical protein VF156_15490 [Agromyces sp.]
MLTCDRGDADGIMCGEPGCSGWASKLTSPAGRWAAMRHHPGWTPDEWAGLCAYEVPPQSDVLTGIGIVDAGGARVCPSRAVEGDTLCAFHRDRVDPPAAAETPLEQLGLFA